ncbi:uncharacterized protein N7487_007292 [Penicillium crustosum]|uniref:uncharacterized protein n=1 Tax=Penicillium crustosum TaxID=36656 RepID=UPI0023A0CBBD|nr:uncharacterized protein N7487_007292 [Penicillium crustosum]KAJ5401396.1 hypothetical protein N7487_007292 [Penicillium crustosum]
MRFPTSPLSSSREISNSSFSSFPLLPSPPFSYCSKISVSIFCLVYREFCFSSLVADYSFLPRAFPVFSQVFLESSSLSRPSLCLASLRLDLTPVFL